MSQKYRLIVTFDIPGAKGGDARYKLVDKYLDTLGDWTKVFKQVRLLKTNVRPQVIAPAITEIIGPVGSVLVVQASRPYRFVLGKDNPRSKDRNAIERWLNSTRSGVVSSSETTTGISHQSGEPS